MTTDTLSREDTKIDTSHSDGADRERFAHYFSKKDIERAYFDNAEIKALCGKKDRPTRDFTKFPVCPTCKEKYENLKG